jgi:hypothetical protein
MNHPGRVIMARADSRLVKTCASALLVIVLCFSSLSCTSRYFQTLQPPEQKVKFSSLGDLPWHEQWAGCVFSGEKIGFTHLKIEPLGSGEHFRLTSDAHLHLRVVGMDWKVSMKGVDTVGPDLSLLQFRYDLDLNGKKLLIDGEVKGGRLQAIQESGGEKKTLVKELSRPVFPAGGVNFFPLIAGMSVGSNYRYDVFDPQTQTITEVTQSVVAFEKSPELLMEPSFRVETTMLGQSVTSWITTAGETILEFAMHGVLITYKEDEGRAKQFLSEASMNRKDLVLDFSLVKADRPLPCPRQARYLKIAIDGVAGELPLLVGPGQSVTETGESGSATALYVIEKGAGPDPPRLEGVLNVADRYIYLAATDHIESDHPEIGRKANEIVDGAPTDLDKIRRLAKWVSEEVKDEIVDSFSALEVLHSKKGECQAHTLLYAALARAEGIPTRLIGGLVYLEETGFVYHAWAESHAGGWIAVDPTFNQVGLDATHIKLVEGPSWVSMVGVGKVVGRVRASVLDYRTACHE